MAAWDNYAPPELVVSFLATLAPDLLRDRFTSKSSSGLQRALRLLLAVIRVFPRLVAGLLVM
jgi:hypothetical protein